MSDRIVQNVPDCGYITQVNIIFRIIHSLVDSNIYDVIFVCNKAKIPAVKSLLIQQNPYLKSLVINSSLSAPVVLNPVITEKAFNLILTYYGYGQVILTEENCIEILIASFFIDVIHLIKTTKLYINDIVIILGILKTK